MTARRWELVADLCAAVIVLGVVAVYAGLDRVGVAVVVLGFCGFAFVMPRTLEES